MVVLSSCFGLFDSGDDKITDEYHVAWMDLHSAQGIYHNKEEYGLTEQVIPNYVFAVGYNDDFIVAKQHPTNGFYGGHKIFKDTLNFFIIQIQDEMDSIYGPLTKEEFALKAKEFDIQNITFDMKYPEMCYD